MDFSSLPISKLTQKPVIHFVHANGLPSQVYEPLFAVLEKYFTVEYIARFAVDDNYPVDDHWQSLTRHLADNVQKVCQKHQVKQVVGLGHSLGAMCTLQAMYKYPHLFAQTVLLDPPLIYGATSFFWHIVKLSDRLPFMNHRYIDRLSPAQLSKRRRDVWDSREQAYDSLRHKAFFKDFDEHCFQNYIQYGLCERADGKMTLSIPKDKEMKVFRTNPSWYWLTPNHAPKPAVTMIYGQSSIFERKKFPKMITKRLKIPHIYHKGGHMFPLEHPKSVAESVLAVIDKQMSINKG